MFILSRLVFISFPIIAKEPSPVHYYVYTIPLFKFQVYLLSLSLLRTFRFFGSLSLVCMCFSFMYIGIALLSSADTHDVLEWNGIQ